MKGERLAGGGGVKGASYDHKLDESLCRTRRTILDLILCNRFEFFCTFTFDGGRVDRMDYDSCRKKLTKWFENFRSRYAPSFKYLVVPERHKDGAWHFHGLVRGIPRGEFSVPDYIHVRDRRTQRLRSVRNVKGYIRWDRYSKAFGFFDCSAIRSYDACAVYVSKYITKDLNSFTKGRHLYFCSAGLARPDLVYDQAGVPFVLAADHENEFCRVAWATGGQVIGTYLPEWYDECCADLRDEDVDLSDGDRGTLEARIFEPLRYDQLCMV